MDYFLATCFGLFVQKIFVKGYNKPTVLYIDHHSDLDLDPDCRSAYP